MAAKKQYLYAVQRDSGHEVVSALVDGATPTVEAQHMENGLVRLVRGGEVIATGVDVLGPEMTETLTLYRWAADDKLGEPTTKAVDRV